jgi:hypothetical protein
MFYILVRFTNPPGNTPPFDCYQEIYNGEVQRYTTLDGVTIDPSLLAGPSRVLNDNPPQPPWALPDPIPPDAPPSIRYTTKEVLWDRFTDVEQRDLVRRHKQTQQAQDFVSVFFHRMEFATSVKLGVQTPISVAVLSLEQGGALAVGRAAEIMNVPIELTQPDPALLSASISRLARR